MIETRLRFETNLDRGLSRTVIKQELLTGDDMAHTFEIAVRRGSEAVALTGASVQAYFVRADRVSVPITGSVSGNVASITLPKGCYNVHGRYQLVVKLTLDGEVSSVFWGDGAVGMAYTDAMLDEEGIIPSLDELLAQIAAMETATEAAQAATDSATSAAAAATAKAAAANTAAQNASEKATAAGTAATRANNAAAALEGLSIEASGLAAGAAPTAQVTDKEGHKHIALGIPKGDKGDVGATPVLRFTAATGAAGTEVQLVQGGTPEEPTVALTIPRGLPGEGNVNAVDGILPDDEGNVPLGAVRYGEEQTLTDAQKEQALGNIGAAAIDDAAISATETWSSQRIYDAAIYEDRKTGAVVQGHWLPMLPLGVRVDIEAKQAGTGDPSPTNIRPITGVSAVHLTKCRKNLISQPYSSINGTKNGLTFSVLADGGIKVSGTATELVFFNFANIYYKLNLTNETVVNGMSSSKKIDALIVTDCVLEYRPIWGHCCTYLVFTKDQTVDKTYYPRVEVGTTATEYEPYDGETHAITLPETCYGGYIDWQRKKYVKTHEILTVSSDILSGAIESGYSESYGAWFRNVFYAEGWKSIRIGGFATICSACDVLLNDYKLSSTQCRLYLKSDAWSSVSECISAIADLENQGSPIHLVAELETPIEFDLPDLPSLYANDGVTTLFTDEGTLTVTGKGDARHFFSEMNLIRAENEQLAAQSDEMTLLMADMIGGAV